MTWLTDHPALAWLALALVLAAIEVATLDLIFIMLGAGGLVAALAAALGAPFVIQVVVAVAVALLLLGVLRPVLVRRLHQGPETYTGTAVLVGNVAPKVEFPLQVAVTRELAVHGSCASRGEYPACLAMLARGALRAEPLLSATAPLAEGAMWFDRLYRKEPGLMKVVLQP